jgi:predicted kinase
MRHLVLLRGAPGTGKSTFIKNNGLEPWTLNPDNIRMMFQAPILTSDGEYRISSQNDKKVWRFLFDTLEKRMEHGDFTIVDATHSKVSDINLYKELALKYRYRVTVLDFSDVPIETARIHNWVRPEYKRVSNAVIDRMQARIDSKEPPRFVTVVKPQDFMEYVQFKKEDLSSWKRIHFIGDIHGCYGVLMECLNGGLKDDELYVFTGDYLDRGIQNVKVIKFLFAIMNRENVILLEGNHEIHLWHWANDEPVKSSEFRNVTAFDLEHGGISKKDARVFYRKLRQVLYFSYGDTETVLVSHGGIPRMVDNLMLISTEQFVKGVGLYETPVNEMFQDNTVEGTYQIHAHRNVQNYPVQATERTFNLEAHVEHGGFLRAVILDKDGFHTKEIKNNVYSPRFEAKKAALTNPVEEGNKKFLEALRGCKDIKEKNFGRISSFNFTERAFYKGNWNKLTTKARGLFINVETTEIVARSYNKFFKINELQETKLENLQSTLTFPVEIYVKYNGYLGILGYDSQQDELVVASKSTTLGSYAANFANLLYGRYLDNDVKIQAVKSFLRKTNSTMVFEVIDPVGDPHIIEYKEAGIVLLDVIKRTPEFMTLHYKDLMWINENFGLPIKERVGKYDSWIDFYNWCKLMMDDWTIKDIEGFVIEDRNGYMLKLKLPFYNFWKKMRGVAQVVATSHVKPKSIVDTQYAESFYRYLNTLDKEYVKNHDIITLRKGFEKERNA